MAMRQHPISMGRYNLNEVITVRGYIRGYPNWGDMRKAVVIGKNFTLKKMRELLKRFDVTIKINEFVNYNNSTYR